MKRNYLYLVFCIITLCCNLVFALNTEGRRVELPIQYQTYSNESFHDYVYYFAPILEHLHVSKFLVFGLGMGTEVFLDHCDFVTSIELCTEVGQTKLFGITAKMFSNRNNWSLRIFECDELLINANKIAMEEQDLAIQLPGFKEQLEKMMDQTCLNEDYDVAFVDSTFALRGDIVNFLFHKVPIIAAHDTSGGIDYFGWSRIVVPSDYIQIVLPTPQGTTFWVHRTKLEWIDFLLVLQKNFPYKKFSY